MPPRRANKPVTVVQSTYTTRIAEGLDRFMVHDPAAYVAAAHEVMLRALAAQASRPEPLTDADALYGVAAPLLLVDPVRERTVLVLLDAGLRPLEVSVISVGSTRFSVVDPKDIARRALLAGAAAVALAHNHPSGTTAASPQDVEVTKLVGAALRTVGVTLVDHLIVTTLGHRSMRGMGDCPSAFGQ